MHFSGPALAAVLIPLALAGCSSDVNTNGSGDASPSTDSPSAMSDPITFLRPADQEQSSAELACTDPGDEVLVMAGLKTSTPVTVESVVPFGGTGFTVKEASVTAMDSGRRPTAALLHEPARASDLLTSKGYDDRTELAETELEPGTLYQLFVTTEVDPDDGVDGYELGWTTDGERGTSELSSQVTAGSPC